MGVVVTNATPIFSMITTPESINGTDLITTIAIAGSPGVATILLTLSIITVVICRACRGRHSHQSEDDYDFIKSISTPTIAVKKRESRSECTSTNVERLKHSKVEPTITNLSQTRNSSMKSTRSSVNLMRDSSAKPSPTNPIHTIESSIESTPTNINQI